MGCGPSNPLNDESKAIDRQIKRTREKMQHELKLLLLGTGGSGKSTIARQMKIIHLNGYDSKERSLFTSFVFVNVFGGMKSVIGAMDMRGKSPAPENEDVADQLRKLTCLVDTVQPLMNPEMGAALTRLWNDAAVQETWESVSSIRTEEFRYFITRIDDIAAEEYVPTTDDVLHVRIKTTGIKELQFALKGFTFRVVDVGGQRSERRKWIHCFQDVTAILYVCAMSDYDLKLEEDAKTNRMVESLDLFHKVANNKWFSHVSVVLFLNKKDVFVEKIKQVPFTNCWKHFPQDKDAHSYTDCVEFLSSQFRESNVSAERNMYVHETCATDTDNIKVIWSSVTDVLMMHSLKEAQVWE